jgi:superfamily II DNA or RNA helicase
MCPDGFVYNLEVAEHHNYFANGVLVHNCHHQIAPSWLRLRERLNPAATCGFSATPITPTGGGLAPAGFTDLVIGPEPRWLMDNGFLCDYKLYGAPAEINTDGVSTRGGDYAVDQLEQRVVEVEGSIIRDWRKFNPNGLSTICVGVSVEHAHRLVDLYRRAGVTAAVVDGATPTAERDDIFARFRSGDVTVLCACAVVDEGLDVPSATCLQLLRPTRSIRLYRQLIGRVLRPSPGKEHAIIIDHSGSWRELPLPDDPIEWTLNERVRRVPAEDRDVTRDEGSYEVLKRETVAVEDMRPMMLVTPESKAEALRLEARRRFHKTLHLVQSKIIPEDSLRKHMSDARWLSREELLTLQGALMLPRTWAEQQLWMNQVGL